jgi:hypothetical protein
VWVKTLIEKMIDPIGLSIIFQNDYLKLNQAKILVIYQKISPTWINQFLKSESNYTYLFAVIEMQIPLPKLKTVGITATENASI